MSHALQIATVSITASSEDAAHDYIQSTTNQQNHIECYNTQQNLFIGAVLTTVAN